MKKSGYVAVVGRPNVGKSTLINHLLGQKIAITSRKPQTTRHALLGIYTEKDTQIVFIDTPGIHRENKKSINRQMNRTAWQSMEFVDLVVHVSEAGKWTDEDMRISQGIGQLAAKRIHVLNKIDRIEDKTALLAMLSQIDAVNDWQAIVPVSAQKKQNLSQLIQSVERELPEQEWLFPEDQITTAGMRFMASELIREKLFRYLHQEIPYALGVIIDDYQEEAHSVSIAATILVERDSQKGIVIGKGGKTLGAIGKAARIELEQLLEKKVMLKNFVKVKDNWRDNNQIIQSMGQGNNSTL